MNQTGKLLSQCKHLFGRCNEPRKSGLLKVFDCLAGIYIQLTHYYTFDLMAEWYDRSYMDRS